MKKPAHALRPLRFHPSYLPHAEGSCLVEMGLTRVLCVASVSDDVPPHAEENGNGWITAEYAMLPRAGETRSPRSRVTGGGRVQEISRLIGRSLRAAVDLSKLGACTITIDCDVLRADGGTRTASVNGGFVALVQALCHLEKKKRLPVWPLREFVAAVSVGVCGGKPELDMCYAFDKDAETDLNVVMTESGKLIELQGTAERTPFAVKDLLMLLNLAKRAADTIVTAQKRALAATLRSRRS